MYNAQTERQTTLDIVYTMPKIMRFSTWDWGVGIDVTIVILASFVGQQRVLCYAYTFKTNNNTEVCNVLPLISCNTITDNHFKKKCIH